MKIVNKKLLSLLHDTIVAIIAIVLSYMLRFNFSIPKVYQDQLLFLIVPIILISLFINKYHEIYKISWRFISISDIKRIMISEINIVIILYLLVANPFINIMNLTEFNKVMPFSVFIIFPILQFLGLICNRILFRFITSSNKISKKKSYQKKYYFNKY